jgi:hypothetical protein
MVEKYSGKQGRVMATIKLNIFFVTCCLLAVVPIFAAGKTDTLEPTPLNNEWVLCVTAFDYSGLPSARRITGDVITRGLVEKLKMVNYRLRISPEYAYYESYAWQQALSTAAKAISNKQNERSQLMFRGDPDWKYRQDLKKIDADLAKLEEEFLKVEADRPLINHEPSFTLSQANIGGTYPEPPKPGAERRFCQNQKSDACLRGEIREFHGRYYVKLRLYTLYTNSWAYEDDIIFSMEDTDGSVEEISARLTAALSGSKPAAIAITANPPDSQILINMNYAGRGVVEARERPPGKIIISVAADDHLSETVETELVAGELLNVNVALSPLQYSNVHIDVPGKDGAYVYQGALYVGEAPLTLRLPLGQINYVTVEASRGETSKVVFTAPDTPAAALDISLKTKIPPPTGQRRVNKARNWYYWAWGGTWVTGIAAWITYGMSTSYTDAYLRSEENLDLYNAAVRMQYISTGTMIAVGAAIAYEIFQMMRYMHSATANTTPIAKGAKQKK